ncbi:C1q domain protein [compost metagenome]
MLIPKFTGFFATRNTNYTFAGGTPSKTVIYPTSTDNPNGWYNTANGRFTPQVAGYYQFNAALRVVSSTDGEKVIILTKNGTELHSGVSSAGSNVYIATVSAVIYLNGTTDYVDVRCFANNALTDIATTPSTSYFQGYLIGQ